MFTTNTWRSRTEKYINDNGNNEKMFFKIIKKNWRKEKSFFLNAVHASRWGKNKITCPREENEKKKYTAQGLFKKHE